MTHTFNALKKVAFEQNTRLYNLGLVRQTFGNVSVADHSSGVFAIKPSGVAYADLKPALMVVVDFEGVTISDNLRPSSDTPTHAALYRHWPDIGGIAHTHSLFGTSWAQSMRPVPIYGTTHADFIATDIPCTPVLEDEMIAAGYERNTGMQIIDHFNEHELDYHDVEMVLLGGHAPFTWGKTAESAVDNSATLEYIAELAYLTEQISPSTCRLKQSLIDKHHNRKHGPIAYYGQKETIKRI